MGLGGVGGAGPEGPPNVTEGAGQAPPPTAGACALIHISSPSLLANVTPPAVRHPSVGREGGSPKSPPKFSGIYTNSWYVSIYCMHTIVAS